MKSLVAVLVVTAVALALVRWLVAAQGVQEPLVPGPEKVAQTFVLDLAERPQDALRMLAPSVQLTTSAMDLSRIDRALRTRYRLYALQSGGQVVRLPQGVQYNGALQTSGGQILPSQFRLRRDAVTGLWQITSFEGLKDLTGQRPLPPADDVPVSL